MTAASPPSASLRCHARRAATRRVVVAAGSGASALCSLEPGADRGAVLGQLRRVVQVHGRSLPSERLCSGGTLADPVCEPRRVLADPRPGRRGAPSSSPGSRAAAAAGRRSPRAATGAARQRRDPGARRGGADRRRAWPGWRTIRTSLEVIVVDDRSARRDRRRRARARCAGGRGRRAAGRAGSASRGRCSRGSRRRAGDVVVVARRRHAPAAGPGRRARRRRSTTRTSSRRARASSATARRAAAAPVDARLARLPLRAGRRRPRRPPRSSPTGRSPPCARARLLAAGGYARGRRPHDRRRGARARARRRGLAGRVRRRDGARRRAHVRVGGGDLARVGPLARAARRDAAGVAGGRPRGRLARRWRCRCCACAPARPTPARPGAARRSAPRCSAALAGAYARRGVPFWLSPLADPATAVRLTLSALRPARTWRGRTY